jgi:hypothetical protein
MPRINSSDELWTLISEVGIIRDVAAGESDVLLTLAAAGATALTETTGTNGWIAGDILRVGTGSDAEVCIVEAYTTPTITIVSGLMKEHAALEPIEEQEKINIGAIADDGVNRENAVEQTEIRAATQAGIYATLTTSVTGRISFNLLTHSLENVLLSMGIDEGNISGTGVVADPYVADINFDEIGLLNNHAIYFTGARKDGTTLQIEAWAVEFDGNQTVTYVRGQQVTLPLAAAVQAFRYYEPIPAP